MRTSTLLGIVGLSWWGFACSGESGGDGSDAPSSGGNPSATGGAGPGGDGSGGNGLGGDASGGNASGGNGTEITSCNVPGSPDLSDLVARTAHSILLQEDDGKVWGFGQLYWLAPDGTKSVVQDVWDNWNKPAVSPNRQRLMYVVGNGQGRSGVPKVMHLTETGSTPLRLLDGNMEYSNGFPSESWTPDSRFFVGWGYLLGEYDESVGVYDTVTETFVGSVPVTDTGSLGDITGCMVSYSYDRSTEKSGVFAVTADGLAPTRLLESDEGLFLSKEGSLWGLDEATGVITRAPRFGSTPLVVATISGTSRLLVEPDGQGAIALVNDELQHVALDGTVTSWLSGVTWINPSWVGGGLFVIMSDESQRFVDATGSEVVSTNAVGGNRVRDSHVIGQSNGLVVGAANGHIELVDVAPGATSVSCQYKQEYGPVDRMAIPYVVGNAPKLALVDISQPKAQVIKVIDGPAGESFSCPIFSIDGTQLTVTLQGAQDKVLTIDWTTAPQDPVVRLTSDLNVVLHAAL